MNQPNTMVKIAYDALDGKKGQDIRILDISQVSVIADYFVIASGSNINQVHALVENVEEQMEKHGYPLKQREGSRQSPWVLLDYTDIIVHIFDKENRLFYDLEHIWHDGREVKREEL